MYACLRRHLSTSYTDRHYDESHMYHPFPQDDSRDALRNVCLISFVHFISYKFTIAKPSFFEDNRIHASVLRLDRATSRY